MLRPGGAVMGLFCTAARTDHVPFTKYEIVDDASFRHRVHPGRWRRQARPAEPRHHPDVRRARRVGFLPPEEQHPRDAPAPAVSGPPLRAGLSLIRPRVDRLARHSISADPRAALRPQALPTRRAGLNRGSARHAPPSRHLLATSVNSYCAPITWDLEAKTPCWIRLIRPCASPVSFRHAPRHRAPQRLRHPGSLRRHDEGRHPRDLPGGDARRHHPRCGRPRRPRGRAAARRDLSLLSRRHHVSGRRRSWRRVGAARHRRRGRRLSLRRARQRRSDRGPARNAAATRRRALGTALRAADRDADVRGPRSVRARGGVAGQGHAAHRPRPHGDRLSPARYPASRGRRRPASPGSC